MSESRAVPAHHVVWQVQDWTPQMDHLTKFEIVKMIMIASMYCKVTYSTHDADACSRAAPAAATKSTNNNSLLGHLSTHGIFIASVPFNKPNDPSSNFGFSTAWFSYALLLGFSCRT